MELEQIKGLLDLVNLEDITAIKKAYAKQVKLHHPEEEPQAFQLLQTAYREAVQYAQAQRAGHAIKVNVLQEKAEESNDESFEAVSAGSVSSCEGLVQAAPKTTDERIEELLQALQSGNTLAVKKQLQTAQRLALLQDTAFLTALSEGLQNQVNLLSYAMRQTLIQAFHLDAGQLQPAQQELLSSIRQGIPDFQSYRYSCKRDTAYLLDTWRALCQSREEDSEAWLEFLNHKHWTKDTVDELTAEKILALEMKKCYAHSSAVAGKIYSFLHIRDHLAQDPAQTYAKLKELLGKDASFTQQNFISWRNHVQKQALQFFELSHEDKGAEVWEEWLHKQSLDKADLYLLERLSYYAKRHHYKKEVRNLLFSYFELETADTPAKQSLRKAILEEPPVYRRKKRMLLLLVLLAALSAVLIPALLGRAQEQRKAEDRKQEELRNIQQEMLEESQRKSQEQLEALQKKIEAGNQ